MAAAPTVSSSVAISLLAFTLSRVFILACAWAGLSVWGVDAVEAAASWRPFGSTSTLIDVALRYDAQWYLTIARDGYGGTLAGPYFDMRPNFMPLLPLLVRAVGSLGLELVTAGLVIANLCSVVGLACFHQVVARQSSARSATVSLWVVALFPTSFFLSSVYSEGPLLAFTMGAWLAALAKRPALAGVLALGATLTRPLGGIVLIPLAIVAWQQRSTIRSAASALVAASVPSILGLGGYLWWAQRTWGDALMITRTQAAYRSETAWPWAAFLRWWAEGPALHGYANSTIDAALAVGAIVAVGALLWQRWLAGAAFGAAAVLVPLSSGLIAFSRMLLAAPVLAATVAAAPLANWRTARFWLWWLPSLALLAWFSARFATWRWVA